MSLMGRLPPTAFPDPLAEVTKSAKGETTCDKPATYLQLADRIREWDPSIDTIILTSEDPKVVEEVLALTTASKERGEFAWKIVLNKGDVMQGSGSATFFVERSSSMGDAMSISEQVVSSFSSLYLQMRSRYLVTSSRTSFHILMSLLHSRDRATFATDRFTLQLETAATFVDRSQYAYRLVICGN